MRGEVHFDFDLYNSVVNSGPLLKHASFSSTANIEDSEAPILTIKQQSLGFHFLLQVEQWLSQRDMWPPSSFCGIS